MWCSSPADVLDKCIDVFGRKTADIVAAAAEVDPARHETLMLVLANELQGGPRSVRACFFPDARSDAMTDDHQGKHKQDVLPRGVRLWGRASSIDFCCFPRRSSWFYYVSPRLYLSEHRKKTPHSYALNPLLK